MVSSLLDLLRELHKPRNLDLEPVFRLLRDERWQVRYSAIQALTHADSPDAEDKLIEVLTTTNHLDDILYCQGALHEAGSIKSIPYLEKNLSSKKTRVKSSAHAAIKAIKWRIGK